MSARDWLSKSRYQTGLTCRKALWLAVYERHLADPITEGQQARFEGGQRIGALARDRFPGGVLVEEGHTEQRAALARTRELLEQGVPVIYEAAFAHDDVLVRADVMLRDGDVWNLVEMKSTVACKPEHVTDAAIQTYVVEGTDLRVGKTFVGHLDKTYVYPGGDYDLDALFALADVTEAVRAYLPSIPAKIADLKEMLSGPRPEVRIGKQCSKPYACSFFGHCHEFMPPFPVTEIPYLSEKGLTALLDDELYGIMDIPLDHRALTDQQREACAVIQSGEMRLLSDLGRTLEQLVYPVHCLDFETFKPALPLYPGTHAHQSVPFQWSDHVINEDGDLEHREFLFEGDGDPRPQFLMSLLRAVDGKGSVVVYSPYENTTLKALAADLPEYQDQIAELQGRLFDLEKKVVKQHIRHPDFHAFTSIKYVLPALVNDLSYDGLAIQNGDAAMLRYESVAARRVSEDERQHILNDLREYCGTDTLGLVKLLERSRELAQ